MFVSTFDDTVTIPVALARALKLPHIPPVIRPVETIPVADNGPVAANFGVRNGRLLPARSDQHRGRCDRIRP